jgi:hypothetical protein
MGVSPVGLGFQTRFVQFMNVQPMSSPRLPDTSLIRYNVWIFLIFLKRFFLEKKFSWFFGHKIIKLEDYFTPSFFTNREWAPRLWVEFERRIDSSTQFNLLNKVECPTSSMDWIRAFTLGFVQPDDHSTLISVSKLKKKRFLWNMHFDTIDKNEILVFELKKHFDLYIVEYNSVNHADAFVNFVDSRVFIVSKDIIWKFYLRLDHCQSEVIN